MSRSLRLILALAFVAVVAVGNVASTAAGGPKILDARLTGLPRAGLVVDGVTGGGSPWVIDEGTVHLFADGRLQVEVNGLVLASSLTNPVASGHAIVTCDGAPAATTSNVPFSPKATRWSTPRSGFRRPASRPRSSSRPARIAGSR